MHNSLLCTLIGYRDEFKHCALHKLPTWPMIKSRLQSLIVLSCVGWLGSSWMSVASEDRGDAYDAISAQIQVEGDGKNDAKTSEIGRSEMSGTAESGKISEAPQTNVSAKLSPLAARPDWRRLDAFQRSISKEEFVGQLNAVYAPGGAWRDFIVIDDGGAVVSDSAGRVLWRLHFVAGQDRLDGASPAHSSAPNENGPHRSLKGLRIAIDPGHIGGKWARIEERWYKIGENKPVMEGDMTLQVAKLLREELAKRGAVVSLTRETASPSTLLRPEDLLSEAKLSLTRQGTSQSAERLRQESEKLFYRTAEIRARADLVNRTLRPDVVLALHFNAEPWGNAERPSLVETNHLHLLVTGGFTREELTYEDQLHGMLTKLLGRCFSKESGLAKALAKSMSAATGLPPYIYKESAAAVRIPGSDYVWARNLLANRLFECPVIYLEPYVMNSHDVHERVQVGDYEGAKVVNGKNRKSIYREYVEGVVAGLEAYYSQHIQPARSVPEPS
jgi:N-acetylmuramoyl-L-alanine amidase